MPKIGFLTMKHMCQIQVLTFSSVQVKKWLKTSLRDNTGWRVILSIHSCNNFILESMNSSSYRPDDEKIIKFALLKHLLTHKVFTIYQILMKKETISNAYLDTPAG